MAANVLSLSTIELMAEAVGTDRRGYVHLLPKGRFTGVDGRGPYVADNPNQIIDASRKYAGQRKMVIDYDHSTDLARGKGEPLPAAGWIVGMQTREDGIWGQVEWTERAADFIAKREYRYLSPVFMHAKDTGEIGIILRASLTNTPNLDQLTALASAREPTMDLRSKIVALLGLDPQADDNAILQALGACAQKAAQSEQPDPAKWVPIGDFQRTTTELNRLRQGISQQAAEERVDGDIRKGVLPPFTKDWAVSLCMSNVPAYDQFIKNVGPGFSYLWNKIGTPSLHSEATELTENEKAVARNLGLSDKEFIASRGKN